MSRGNWSTEAIITPLDPKRAFRIADECLIEIRLIETRRESSIWMHEYEISGEVGKIIKFTNRLRNTEIKK